ncbi:NmrA family NAD(P)-binding protein [Novosphingobium malaysiense]|uniref:NmrA-like domain-containing protein n=1 Tax=Novosphingobium malaysiense TaxID=1348853 RepID=A0A0B1ZDL6_9SPHN|nr:NmrA family NAD(P)-binding protein [Novosphingobium malaysiense]KHK89109.1 hypothetical protein LK12_22555 [Novosphingobium malaysiense]
MNPAPEAVPFLVFGGTGAQGGAVIDALLSRGLSPKAYVRDVHSRAARALAGRGVSLVRGAMDDRDALLRAMEGIEGVFSMQPPPAAPADPDLEMRYGRAMVAAALQAGVSNFVHTSVARADEHENFAGWSAKRWWPLYWESKAAVNNAVRDAGFRRHMILKPAWMMDNLLPPRADWMVPGLKLRGALESALDPATCLDVIAAADIGEFGAAALLEPDRFNAAEIPLASQALTTGEIARSITDATGRRVVACHVSPQDAAVLGHHAGLTESQQWCNVEGYRVDHVQAASWGIALTGFARWAQKHANRFVIGPPEAG